MDHVEISNLVKISKLSKLLNIQKIQNYIHLRQIKTNKKLYCRVKYCCQILDTKRHLRGQKSIAFKLSVV